MEIPALSHVLHLSPFSRGAFSMCLTLLVGLKKFRTSAHNQRRAWIFPRLASLFEDGVLKLAPILLHLHVYEVFLLCYDYLLAAVEPLNSK